MSVKVEFILGSDDLNVEGIDSVLNIHPSHIRTNIPPNSIATPEWWIEAKEESLCVDKTVRSIAKKLSGKKQKIEHICKQFHVVPKLIIRVYSNYANRPDFSLSPKTVKFFAALSTEVIIDLEAIYDQKIEEQDTSTGDVSTCY